MFFIALLHYLESLENILNSPFLRKTTYEALSKAL